MNVTDTSPITTQDPSRAAPPGRARRWLFLAIKLSLLAAVLYYVGRAIHAQLREVLSRPIEVRPLYIAAAAGCMLLVGCVGVAIRRLLLAGFCAPPSWTAMASITWVPLAGKYMPGKVFSLAGTVWMLRRYHVSDPVAASMVLVVNAASMMVGLLLAIPLTFWRPLTREIPLAWLWGVLLMLAFAVCLHPRVFAGVCNAALRRFGRPPLEMVPRVRNYLEPVLLILLNWSLTGTALWLIARAIVSVDVAYLPAFISAAALAATVGLMAFFAPAGLGVREGLQLLVLREFVGGGPAALAAVIMRLVQTFTEVVLIALGAIIAARLGLRPQPAHSPKGDQGA